MKRKSICFLCTRLEYGGAQTQIVDLAINLRNRGWDVSVVSMRPAIAFSDKLTVAGISLKTLGMSKGVPNPMAIIKLVRILGHLKPAILHCHMFHANLLGRISRVFCATPVLISTAHNVYEGARWREISYRITDKLTDLTTNVSKSAVDRYIRVGAVPKHRIKLVYNGLDINRFVGTRDQRNEIRKEFCVTDKFVWLAVGRLSAQKDYPNMLTAFSNSVNTHRNAVLLILGEGELENSLKAMAERLGISDSVYFVGLRSDVEKVMNAADAYLMSSAWEGFPIVLLEAAATELPVVCTDVGGNAEIIKDQYNGFVVKSKDSKLLSDAMNRMMNLSPQYRRKLGSQGRELVLRSFSLDHLTDIWEKLYSEIHQSKTAD